MMKYAIISDIHANLEALHAVLDHATLHAETFVCLGDIVGYNANPNECLELVQDVCEVTILGNHDQAAIGTRPYDDFNPYAQVAIDWTKEQLTPAHLDYLQHLPTLARFGSGALAAHGSPRHTDEYLLHLPVLQQNFIYMRQMLPDIHYCFVGHTHIPMVWECTLDGLISRHDIASSTIALDPTAQYIINPGSVGQPRNGNPAASYLVLDDAPSVTFHSVPYDVIAAQDKIYDAMLPIPLAERLEIGR